MRRTGWLLGLLLGSAGLLKAQQFGFIHYTTRDGLAQSQVRTIAQDGQGFLWIGTLGGVSRFDGSGFRNHALRQGLPDAQVNALLPRSDGSVWCGTGGGLVSFRHGMEVVPIPLPGLDRPRITALATDAGGRVLIGVEDRGVLVHKDGQVSALEGFPADTAGTVRSLLCLADGTVYIGLRNGLLRWADGRCSVVTLGSEDRSNVSSLALGADGTLWVATFGQGVFALRPDGTVEEIDETDGLLQNNVRSVTVDPQGRVWLASKFGVNVIEAGRIRALTVNQGMPNDNIWCVSVDDHGDLWLGTDGAGLLRWTGDRFVTYTQRDGLCSDQVMCLVADSANDLWLGTYGNGICRMDGMALVSTLDGLPNNTVWTGLRRRDNSLWFGTSDGLCRLHNGVVVPLPDSLSLRDERVVALHEDADGTLWCGARDGLYSIREGRLRREPGPPGIQLRSIRDLHRDSEGRLWAAHEVGVARWGANGWTTWTAGQELPAGAVYCLAEDRRGRVWAGTADGLVCFAGSGPRVLRLATDFGSNYIDLLRVSSDGRLWVGTNNGLFQVGPDSLLSGGSGVTHYTTSDGLLSLECNLNASYLDSKGRLLFGTSRGLVVHLPAAEDDPKEEVIPLHITGLRWFLRPSGWEGRSSGTDTLTGLPTGLLLPYERNHLTFDFAGISLSAPEQVVYRYRLLGHDNDWLPETEVRSASFSNLPHGHYVFQVMARGRNGHWSDPKEYAFDVQPPFWARWWFFALTGAVVIGSVGGVARYRSAQRRRQERTRQLMLRSRMLQLEQQALNANMNRHFIFNALNSIQYHINKQDRATANRYLTSFAKLIRKNLDASQSDTTSLAEELERLELYLILEHMRFKDRFRYVLTVEPGVDTLHVRLPAMMLQPYVENSIWHGILPTERQGQVSIRVSPGGPGRVRVTIADDGLGIEQSKARKQDGDHISRGIEITKGRADVLRNLQVTDIRITGPEQVQGPEGMVHGTRVTIDLPGNGPSPRPEADLRSGPGPLIFGT